jgi:hypothetical protein
MGGRRGERRRAIAIAASLLLHAGLLGVLAMRLSAPTRVAEAPPMQVMLAPWPVRPSRPAPEAKPPRRQAITRHLARSSQSAEALVPPPAPMPSAAAPPPDAGQKVLRGLLACGNADLLRLSAEERARCQARAGSLAAAEPKLKLDRGFVADRDQEEILIRKPVDGCRVRAAGDRSSPSGAQRGVTAGVGCAWRF